jgi:hypothetical protein
MRLLNYYIDYQYIEDEQILAASDDQGTAAGGQNSRPGWPRTLAKKANNTLITSKDQLHAEMVPCWLQFVEF